MNISMFIITEKDIRDAENAVNRILSETGYVTLNDFFQELRRNKMIEGSDVEGKSGYDGYEWTYSEENH